MSVVLRIFAENWYWFLITAAIAYLLGSINPAVIVTKAVTKGKKDIREMGSGNAGFTNVLRSVGKVPAIITIVCDALKCILAVFIGYFLIKHFVYVPVKNEWFQTCFYTFSKYWTGVFCILGHAFPIYFHFKGGKGIVTAAALMLSTDWRVFLMVLATFLIVFIIGKIISLASITGAILYAPYTFLCTFVIDRAFNTPYPWYVASTTACALIIGAFAVFMHRENIKRLKNGEEKKIRAKKKT